MPLDPHDPSLWELPAALEPMLPDVRLQIGQHRLQGSGQLPEAGVVRVERHGAKKSR